MDDSIANVFRETRLLAIAVAGLSPHHPRAALGAKDYDEG
jgi:hypothetical protein